MKTDRIKIVLIERKKNHPQPTKELGENFKTVNTYCSNRQQLPLEVLNEIAKILPVNIKDSY